MANRNLFNHSAGKGDKPRSKFDANWVKNFNEIWFPPRNFDGYVTKGGKRVRKF